jgi:tetratricopeptide (TPR) repeat protein
MSAIGKEAQQLLRRAWDAADKEDLPRALEEINRALELRPKQTRYWATKGSFLREMARMDEAEQALRTAIELDERNFMAWTELAQVYETQGLFEKAAFCLGQSVGIKPDFHTYTMLANVQLAFDAGAALRSAGKALEMNPDWNEAEKIKQKAKRISMSSDGR